MSKAFIAIIKNKGLTWTSDAHRAMFVEFLRENEGKKLRIELVRNPVSDELRGWYYAAILPTVRAVIPEWKKVGDEDLHSILKKMFEFFDAYNVLTKRTERFARSVLSGESNTIRAMAFIEKIRAYFGENYGLDIPSPEEWKKERDSAPMKYEKLSARKRARKN